MSKIQCVDMAAFWMKQGQVVDLNFSVLGDPGQCSVSVDICRAASLRGSPHQLTLSQVSQRNDVVSKERDSQSIMNLLVTSVPGCTGSNVKTLGLKHLQFPYMGVSGRPPDGACIVHHRMDELCVQQNSIPDGDHIPCLGEVPAFPVSVLLYFSSD